MSTFPLIRHQQFELSLAIVKGELISARQFLSDVSKVANLLPQKNYILNLCSDRYRFTVVFCAALLKQQISLLPPNQTPELIEQLNKEYSGIYCVTDSNQKHSSLETFFFPEIANTAQQNISEMPEINGDQVAALVFTSGSTGKPVAHPKTWENLVKSALAEVERLQLNNFPGMTVLGTVPPQHMYGLESTVLMLLQSGLVIYSGRPFYAADITAALSAIPRPRGLVTTPVHLRSLLSEMSELPQVDFLLCATSPLAIQLAIEAEEKFSAPLYEIYGCTEAGQVATRRSATDNNWQLFKDLQLRQEEDKTWVSGGHVSEETLLNDVIELCGDDKFSLHGRTSDLVNIAGKRTSLANLNYHLNAIEGVKDGVYMMRDTDSDHGVSRLIAFVVAPDKKEETILQALRNRIDTAFMPRPLYLVDALPRNTTGKLTRDALIKLEQSVKKRDK